MSTTSKTQDELSNDAALECFAESLPTSRLDWSTVTIPEGLNKQSIQREWRRFRREEVKEGVNPSRKNQAKTKAARMSLKRARSDEDDGARRPDSVENVTAAPQPKRTRVDGVQESEQDVAMFEPQPEVELMQAPSKPAPRRGSRARRPTAKAGAVTNVRDLSAPKVPGKRGGAANNKKKKQADSAKATTKAFTTKSTVTKKGVKGEKQQADPEGAANKVSSTKAKTMGGRANDKKPALGPIITDNDKSLAPKPPTQRSPAETNWAFTEQVRGASTMTRALAKRLDVEYADAFISDDDFFVPIANPELASSAATAGPDIDNNVKKNANNDINTEDAALAAAAATATAPISGFEFSPMLEAAKTLSPTTDAMSGYECNATPAHPSSPTVSTAASHNTPITTPLSSPYAKSINDDGVSTTSASFPLGTPLKNRDDRESRFVTPPYEFRQNVGPSVSRTVNLKSAPKKQSHDGTEKARGNQKDLWWAGNVDFYGHKGRRGMYKKNPKNLKNLKNQKTEPKRLRSVAAIKTWDFNYQPLADQLEPALFTDGEATEVETTDDEAMEGDADDESGWTVNNFIVPKDAIAAEVEEELKTRSSRTVALTATLNAAAGRLNQEEAAAAAARGQKFENIEVNFADIAKMDIEEWLEEVSGPNYGPEAGTWLSTGPCQRDPCILVWAEVQRRHEAWPEIDDGFHPALQVREERYKAEPHMPENYNSPIRSLEDRYWWERAVD